MFSDYFDILISKLIILIYIFFKKFKNTTLQQYKKTINPCKSCTETGREGRGWLIMVKGPQE
jgi:hypothetical protein